MMGDTNIALREGKMVLTPNDRLNDEMKSIIKEKRDNYAKPKFGGKEHSESGKDDAAMATVLSAFPPNHAGERPSGPVSRDRPSSTPKSPTQGTNKPSGEYNPSHSATTVSRSSRTRTNRYSGRNTRHTRGKR